MAKHKWITEDFYWKIFSVVLAVVVWLIVHNFSNEGATPGLLATQDIYTNSVPVWAVSAMGNIQDIHIEPNTVTVTVSGAPDVIATLSPSRLHAIVNLIGIDSAHDLKRRVDVAAPPRVTLLNVDPPDVTVTISANK